MTLLNTICMSQTLQIPQIKFLPQKYICYKTNEIITIDGKLIESSWSKAEWTDDFVDIEGSSKPVPRYRTRAKMLWDDNYLYIAAEIDEPDIWTTLTQRDTVIFYDNDFEVFIDPDGDTHRSPVIRLLLPYYIPNRNCHYSLYASKDHCNCRHCLR